MLEDPVDAVLDREASVRSCFGCLKLRVWMEASRDDGVPEGGLLNIRPFLEKRERLKKQRENPSLRVPNAYEFRFTRPRGDIPLSG